MNVMALLSGEPKLARAIDIYRITMPYHFAREKSRVNGFYHITSDVAQKYYADYEHIKEFGDVDILVIARAVSNEPDKVYDSLAYFRRIGGKDMKIVYEVDDDLTERYRDISNGTGATCLPYLPLVDAITVSTEYLANTMRNLSDKPVYVLPNHINVPWFRKASREADVLFPDTVNVMLTGSPTHGTDWIPAVEAMTKVLSEGSGVRLLVGGFKPDYLPELGNQVRFLQFTPYEGYPGMLRQADIVLAVIDPDDEFNRNKSDIKALESWSAERDVDGRPGGAAVIATNGVVYGDTIRDGVDGVLVNDHSSFSWYKAIRSVLSDNEFRRRLQINGLKKVLKTRDIRDGVKFWTSAYHKIRRMK